MPHDDYLKVDEELLDQVIAEYLRAEAVGQAGDPQQWFDRYPTCAAALSEFLEDRKCLGRVVAPATLPERAVSSRRSMRSDVVPASSPETSAQTVVFAPEPPCLSATRYRPVRFHARGGMGEIWLANDERIGRRVAVKKVRSGCSTPQDRFFAEAQITGQLEHPSIVPLHDLGLDEAGQPFYVMKFIKGRKFRELIAEYHAQKSSSDWPNDLEFRELLQRFVSVCNVIAYAHSKGVLHRDIKPDNVMLGTYGETLVVDWGLAKVIGRPEDPFDMSVRISASGSAATQDGAIVGSPVYMSPEVALGNAAAIDQSNDVYLLGATLYEVITANPPRQGTSQWELIALARHSRPTDPRKLDARIPRALEAICMKAMAFEKCDRYLTPMALGEDIQRFLAGEPTTAYKETLGMRLWRWLRRHRLQIKRGLAFLCVFLMLCLSLYGYRHARQLELRERAREQLTKFNYLADEAQFFAANTDAISEKLPYYDPSRAMRAADEALAAAKHWGIAAEDLPISDERSDVLQTEYALLLSMARENLHALNYRKSLTLLDQAKAIRQPTRGYYELLGRTLKLAGENDSAQQATEMARGASIPMTAQDHFLRGELLRLHDAGSTARMIAAESPLPHEYLVEATDEYGKSLQMDPRHYWARFQLGRCQLALGKNSEAVETLSTCIALRPNSPWAFAVRGLAHALAERPNQALGDLNRALEIDPSFQPARLNRGVVQWLLKGPQAATDDFDTILALSEDKRLSEAAFYRGQMFMAKKEVRKAIADFDSAIRARPKLRATYWFRAKSYFLLGDYEKGQTDIVKFLETDESNDKGTGQANKQLAMAKCLRKLAQELDGVAQKHLLTRAAHDLRTAMSSETPPAEMFLCLGSIQELLGQLPQAIDSYSQGLKLFAANVPLHKMRGWAYIKQRKYDLAKEDFAVALHQMPNDPESHSGLGFVFAETGRNDQARHEASVALLNGYDNYLVLHNVACVYARLSTTDRESQQEHENLALSVLKRAVDLSHANSIGPDEIPLIRQESAFPESLCARPEFAALLTPERGQ